MSGAPESPEAGAGRDAGRSAEEAIIGARRKKAAARRAAGENPFANDVVPRGDGALTVDIAALRARAGSPGEGGRYDEGAVRAQAAGATFHVRGRVVALRSTGGLSFLRLRDRTGEVQLLLSEQAMGAEYGRLEGLDVGDFVEAEGTLTASKRGELSLESRYLRPQGQEQRVENGPPRRRLLVSELVAIELDARGGVRGGHGALSLPA